MNHTELYKYDQRTSLSDESRDVAHEEVANYGANNENTQCPHDVLSLCQGHERPTRIGEIFVHGSVVLYVIKILLRQLGDGGVEGRIILKPTLRLTYEDVEFIHLVQITNQWMSLTTMVTTCLLSLDDWIFFFFEHLGDYKL
jgi:hypothetical protein